jgi:hypothetical protein
MMGYKNIAMGKRRGQKFLQALAAMIQDGKIHPYTVSFVYGSEKEAGQIVFEITSDLEDLSKYMGHAKHTKPKAGKKK